MNIYDYLTWRGDLTFERDPFNDVDNLIFCYAAYTDLREVLKTGKPVTVRMAAEAFFKFHTEEECLKSGSLIAEAPIILRRMGQTKRFGNIKITDYIRDINEEDSRQFSAMHFKIDRIIDYIAFCGTDDTIIGWKEDFQLSYKTVTAQKMAAEYLNNTATKRFHRYYVGGHSKGGNLAVYGAMEAQDDVKKKIIKVYSNDGPGISAISMNEKNYEEIKEKTFKIIPEFSVFGLLFDNHEKRLVVKSEKSGLYEHDAVGWEVSGTSFVQGILSNDIVIIHDVLNEFLESMTLEERKELVDRLYSAFVNAGINNTTDFTKKGIPVLLKFLRQVTNLNENAGKSLEKLLGIIGKTVSEKAGDAVKKTVRNVSEAVPEFIKTNVFKKED